MGKAHLNTLSIARLQERYGQDTECHDNYPTSLSVRV